MERMRDIPISTVVCTYIFIAIPYQILGRYLMDILSSILVIAGVAAVVYGICRYISARVVSHIESSVESILKKRENEIIKYGSGSLFLNLGYNTWVTFKDTGETAHMETAISLTEHAYSIVSELDERETRNELLKCEIMNNLGYYLAERGKPEDREFARDCAQYIRDKIQKHPKRRTLWQHTYDFIFTKYPLSEDCP